MVLCYGKLFPVQYAAGVFRGASIDLSMFNTLFGSANFQSFYLQHLPLSCLLTEVCLVGTHPFPAIQQKYGRLLRSNLLIFSFKPIIWIGFFL